jgi:hypothetical protein
LGIAEFPTGSTTFRGEGPSTTGFASARTKLPFALLPFYPFRILSEL